MLAFASPATFNPHTSTSMNSRQSADMGADFFREHIRELAQQRARKAQWLPDEVDDSDEELDSSKLGPNERRFLDAMRTQQRSDRSRNEHEARVRAMREESERHRQAAAERLRQLERSQVEAQEARQRKLEQMRRQMEHASETRAAALERQANLRAELIREQLEHNISTAGHSPPRSRPYNSRPVPIHVHQTHSAARSPSPSPKTNPVHESKSSPSPKPVYTEKHETSASLIQQQFRIHRSLRSVSDIALEFESLKIAFVYPDVLDFKKPGSEDGHVSVSTTHAPSEFDQVEEDNKDGTLMDVDEPQPKLAYTPVNYHVHLYVDAMEKLLMKLDGVESLGDKSVREKRRSVVREIGKESAKLERYWKQAWKDYVEKDREEARTEGKEQEEQEAQAEQQEPETMEIDDEPVHVEHPEVEDSDEWLDVAELGPTVPSADTPIQIEEGQGTPSLTEESMSSTD